MTLKPFIHIGLPKTASTWLQRNVFSNPELFRYFGEHHRAPETIDGSFFSWIHAIRFLDGLAYDVYEKSVDMLSWIENLESSRGQNPVVISNEGFSSGYLRDAVCCRLKNHFPQAQIIIIIRNQMDILPSMYLQFARGFGAKAYSFTFSEYLARALADMNTKQKATRETSAPGGLSIGYPLARIHYHSLIALYEKQFGRKNVHVFLFESLFDEEQKDLTRLKSLLGIEQYNPSGCQKEHSQMSAREYKGRYYGGSKMPWGTPLSIFYRGLTKLERTGIIPAEKLKLEYTSAEKYALEEFFAPGNTYLLEEYNLDLRKYKYPLLP